MANTIFQIRDIIQKIGNLSLKAANFVAAQSAFETAGFTSNLFNTHNNPGGIIYVGQQHAKPGAKQPKPETGTFAIFDTLDIGYDNMINRVRANIKVAAEASGDLYAYVRALKSGGYFAADINEYYSGVSHFYQVLTGIAIPPENNSNANQANTKSVQDLRVGSGITKLQISNVSIPVQTELQSRMNSINNRGIWATQRGTWCRMYSNAALITDVIPRFLAAPNIVAASQADATIASPPTANFGWAPKSATTGNELPQSFDNGNNNQPILNDDGGAYARTHQLDFGIVNNDNLFTDIYKDNDNFRPDAGIEGITIEYKGELGTSKRAKVHFKCNSLQQLEQLERIYLVPGIRLKVEWGWTLTGAGARVNPDISIDGKNHNDAVTDEHYIHDQLTPLRESNSYCADGFQGIVMNFNYSLNTNLGFDCEVELVTMGDALLSISSEVNSQTANNEKDGSIGGNNFIDKINRLLKAATDTAVAESLHNNQNDLQQRADSQVPFSTDNKDSILYVYTINGATNKTGISGSTDDGDDKAKAFTNRGIYIDWSDFVNIINDSFCGRDNNNSISLSPRLDTGSFCHVPWVDNIMFSSDPRIAVWADEFYKTDERVKNELDDVIYDISFLERANILVNTGTWIDPEGIDGTKLTELLNATPTYRSFSNLQLNLQYLLELAKNKSTVHDILTQLLQDLSDIHGNIWNLVLDSEEDNPNLLVIRDMNDDTMKNGLDTVNPYTFYIGSEIKASKTVVKSPGLIIRASLNTKMTDAMKNMYIYQSNTSNAGSNNTSLIDAFKNFGYGSRDIAYYKNSTPSEDASIESKSSTGTTVSANDNPKKALLDLAKNKQLLIGEVSDDIVDKCKKSLNQYLNLSIPSLKALPNRLAPLLPFELSIEIDGIAGFKWGNAIDLDYLPTRYRHNVLWTVKQVRHVINGRGWTTSLETLMRVKNI